MHMPSAFPILFGIIHVPFDSFISQNEGNAEVPIGMSARVLAIDFGAFHEMVKDPLREVKARRRDNAATRQERAYGATTFGGKYK
jgi:hypothetical protein